MTYYVTCDLSRQPKGNEVNFVPSGVGIWVGRVKKTVEAENSMSAYDAGKAAIEHDCRGTFEPWNFSMIDKAFVEREGDEEIYTKMHECSRLFILRNWREMTQKQLAEAAGIPYRTIQKYENGEASPDNMTIAIAKRIASALNITLDNLI